MLLYDLRGQMLERVGGSSDVLESERVEDALKVKLAEVSVPFRGEGSVLQSGAEVYQRYREGLAGLAESCSVDDFVDFVLGRVDGS